VRDGLGVTAGRAKGTPLGLRFLRAAQRARRKLSGLRPSVRRQGLWIYDAPDLTTDLVISNLTFPDDRANVNGPVTRFDLAVHDHAGKVVATRRRLVVRADETRVVAMRDLLNGTKSPFVGTLFVDYHGVRELGALRPYCRLQSRHGGVHYHDKYSLSPWPGFILSTHVNMPDQEWHAALSNPSDKPYKSEAVLQLASRLEKRTLELPPFGATWFSIRELFDVKLTDDDGAGLFYLESSHRLMAWFFWHKAHGDTWVAQHN
jgi:hypothetical protein